MRRRSRPRAYGAAWLPDGKTIVDVGGGKLVPTTRWGGPGRDRGLNGALH